MSCPNCPCAACLAERGETPKWTGPWDGPFGVPCPPLSDPGPPCAYEAIAKDYAAKGLPMPQTLMLYCPCRRCNPICM